MTYKEWKQKVMDVLEEVVEIKAPADEYLEALKDVGGEVEEWFYGSIEAAKDDVRRQEEKDT